MGKAASIGDAFFFLCGRLVQGSDPGRMHLLRCLVTCFRLWPQDISQFCLSGRRYKSTCCNQLPLLPLSVSCFRSPQERWEVLLFIDLLKLPKYKASTFFFISNPATIMAYHWVKGTQNFFIYILICIINAQQWFSKMYLGKTPDSFSWDPGLFVTGVEDLWQPISQPSPCSAFSHSCWGAEFLTSSGQPASGRCPVLFHFQPQNPLPSCKAAHQPASTGWNCGESRPAGATLRQWAFLLCGQLWEALVTLLKRFQWNWTPFHTEAMGKYNTLVLAFSPFLSLLSHSCFQGSPLN